MLRSRIVPTVAAVTVLVIVAAWWITRPQMIAAGDLPDHAPDPQAGERVFWAGGCASCHASPVDGKRAKGDDKLLLGGGLALYLGFDELKDTWKKEDSVAGPGDDSPAYNDEIVEFDSTLGTILPTSTFWPMDPAARMPSMFDRSPPTASTADLIRLIVSYDCAA